MPCSTVQGRTTVSILIPNQRPYSLPPCIFCCLCFVYNHDIDVKKLDLKSIRMIFLGYSPTQKRYQYLDLSTGRWYVSHNVTFVEHESYFPRHSLQGERRSVEEYSEKKEIQFYDFLHYGCSNLAEGKGGVTSLDESMIGSKESNLYGQMYSRRNKQQTIQYYTNPYHLLNEPSPPMKVET